VGCFATGLMLVPQVKIGSIPGSTVAPSNRLCSSLLISQLHVMARPVKAQFKTPEGRYILHTEKTAGTVHWHIKRTTRLTVAPLSLPDEQQGGCYIVYNLGDYLNICRFDSSHKVWPAAGLKKQLTVQWVSNYIRSAGALEIIHLQPPSSQGRLPMCACLQASTRPCGLVGWNSKRGRLVPALET
jgi:hypothetical protein